MLKLIRGISTIRSQYDIQDFRGIMRTTVADYEKGVAEYRNFRETNDTPDWGVIRISSIAMAQSRFTDAEEFLKEQHLEMGGIQRQARHVEVTDEQIGAAIERVFVKNGVEAGCRFYEILMKYRFCANRDVFLSRLISNITKQSGWKVASNYLTSILKSEIRSKSMTMSAYYILEDAEKKNEIEEAVLVVKHFLKESTLKKLVCFVRINTCTMIDFADFCKRTGATLDLETVIFIVKICGKLKLLHPLETLLNIEILIPVPSSSYSAIFDEYVKIAGKRGNLESLEVIVPRLRHNAHLDSSEKLKIALKIRHFYKCLNARCPDNLDAQIFHLKRN